MLVDRVELGAEFLRRGPRPLVGEALLGGALPEFDLHLLVAVDGALHGAGAVGGIALQRLGWLRRAGRREHEAKAQRAQVEMQIVLVLEQRGDFVLVSRRNELRRRKCLFEIGDDVVALDMHGAIVHQHRHQPARIDAEKPWPEILVAGQIDGMRLPRNAFEVEEDAQLLRARRAHEMQDMHALPVEHLAGLDVAVDKLNHVISVRQSAFVCSRSHPSAQLSIKLKDALSFRFDATWEDPASRLRQNNRSDQADKYGEVDMVTKLLSMVAFFVALAAGAHAQEYPTHLIKILQGFGAGGNVDIIARLLGHQLQNSLGQSVVVEAKPGAAGSLAAETVARSAPDGYTLLVLPSAHPMHGGLAKHVKYNVVDDFTWISTATFYPFLICVRKNSRFQTLKQLIDAAHAEPGGLKYASSGPGTGLHTVVELIAHRTKSKFLHIPYRGEGQATTAPAHRRCGFHCGHHRSDQSARSRR